MHRALWFLLWLDIRSGFRRLVRGKQTWRQLGLVVFLLLFIGMIVGSQILSLKSAGGNNQEFQSLRFGSAMPFWALLYLLVSWLTAAADRGLIMRPAEIQFLVGGPFPPHHIITLNLVRLAYRAWISSMVLAGVAWAYMPNFLSGIVGIWLLLLFSLLVGMLASLSARRALPALVRRARRILSIVAIVVLICMIGESLQIVSSQDEPITFSRLAAAASQTHFGSYVLPPVRWMFLPLQESVFWPTVPLELGLRLPVIAVLVLLIYSVGGSFGEAVTDRTDRALLKRQASLRSGSTASATSFRRLRLPLPSRLGGIGSVAWIEMLQALRMLPRFLFYTAAIVGIVLVAPIMMNRERMQGLNGLGWMAGLISYADFLMLLQLPVGFLGPPSHRETLKQLPVPSWRIVVGMLAGPLLPLVISHLIIGSVFCWILRDQLADVLWTLLALAPVACVLAATINLLGLWNIIKPRALQQRDALAAGRAMLSVWLFSMLLLPTIALAAGSAAATGWLLGYNFHSYLIGATIGVSISCVCLVALLAMRFDAWQPQAGQVGEEEEEFDR